MRGFARCSQNAELSGATLHARGARWHVLPCVQRTRACGILCSVHERAPCQRSEGFAQQSEDGQERVCNTTSQHTNTHTHHTTREATPGRRDESREHDIRAERSMSSSLLSKVTVDVERRASEGAVPDDDQGCGVLCLQARRSTPCAKTSLPTSRIVRASWSFDTFATDPETVPMTVMCEAPRRAAHLAETLRVARKVCSPANHRGR